MRKSNRFFIYAFAVLVFAYVCAPFYWAIVSSLKAGAALFKVELVPSSPTVENYINIFSQQPFGKNLLNSFGVAFLTVLISLAASVLASFALARREFRGRRALLLSFLMVSMFPQIAVLSGLFELIRALSLFNSWLGLTLAYMIFTLPFTVWTLTAFMRELPRELEEAATIDGARPLTIVFKIFLPLLAPSLVTTGLLAFIAAWNEFLFALTFTLSDRARTVPVAIALMSGSSSHELPWGNIMAASVVVSLPLIALVLFFQRKIVSGLTSGTLKG